MIINEGEKSKEKRRGDSVTFRLLKKMKYSNDVIDLINRSTEEGKCNEEVIKALDFYVRYKHREEDIKLFVQFMDKLKNPEQFSEKVIEQLYTQYIAEKSEQDYKEDFGGFRSKDIIDTGEKEEPITQNRELQENEITSDEVKSKVIEINWNNENDDISDEEELFGSTIINNTQNIAKTATTGSSISKAMASIRRKR